MTQAQEIGKTLKCDECGKEKLIATVFLHAERGWIKGCYDCLPHILGEENIKKTREMVFKKEEFCEKHNQPKKLWKQGKNGKLEAHCFDCNREEWLNSLEHLHSDPLKVAKFFYEKGADTWPTIQKLVYFAYVQSIKRKKILFEERFEKWEDNPIPVLVSLYEKSFKGIYPLSPSTVLKDIKEPTEPFIRNILTDVYQNCEYYEEEKRKLDLTLNELLKLTKEEKLDPEKIYSWQSWEKEKYIRSYAS